MTIRCPKCRTPSLLRASEVAEAGRLMRCSNCETTWLARASDDKRFSAAHFRDRARDPASQRPPRIIEGEIVPALRFAGAAAGRSGFGPDPGGDLGSDFGKTFEMGFRAAMARVSGAGAAAMPSWAGRAAAAALVLTLIAVVLLTPAVSALPRLSAAFFGDDSVTLRGVTSRTVTLRGTTAIVVEGELANQTGRELDVPAVRIALKEDGAEVYSWLLEPTVKRVAAGESVGFRSAMASPRPGASQIALSLAGRSGDR
jgi:predicted Zn finger-like uncharacterized protein